MFGKRLCMLLLYGGYPHAPLTARVQGWAGHGANILDFCFPFSQQIDIFLKRRLWYLHGFPCIIPGPAPSSCIGKGKHSPLRNPCFPRGWGGVGVQPPQLLRPTEAPRPGSAVCTHSALRVCGPGESFHRSSWPSVCDGILVSGRFNFWRNTQQPCAVRLQLNRTRCIRHRGMSAVGREPHSQFRWTASLKFPALLNALPFTVPPSLDNDFFRWW